MLNFNAAKLHGGRSKPMLYEEYKVFAFRLVLGSKQMGEQSF